VDLVCYLGAGGLAGVLPAIGGQLDYFDFFLDFIQAMVELLDIGHDSPLAF